MPGRQSMHRAGRGVAQLTRSARRLPVTAVAVSALRLAQPCECCHPAGGLELGLGELGRSVGVGDDAAADVDAQLVALDHADPDREREIERAARAEVTERAAVRTAPRGL